MDIGRISDVSWSINQEFHSGHFAVLWAAKKLHHPIAILDLSDFDDIFFQIFFEAVNESRQLFEVRRASFLAEKRTGTPETVAVFRPTKPSKV